MIEEAAKDRRAQLMLWLPLAAVNIVAGLAIAARPATAVPFEMVRGWGADWLVRGVNVYASAKSGVDYPPHAIVVLSPLSLLPGSVATAVWTTMNVGLALIAPYLAARAVRRSAGRDDILYLTALFLCWGGVRSVLQFSLLALVLALAAMADDEKHAVRGGVCLGLSLMKPQIAAPFFLWAIFARRWKMAGISVLVVAGAVVVFCLRAQANPGFVALRYAQILLLYYTGEFAAMGPSHLLPVLIEVLGGGRGEIAASAAALALLAVVAVKGLMAAGNPPRTMYAAPALAGVWSLLTFYHLTYGFVLLLPLAALLLLDNDARSASARRRLFWIMQVGLMVDVPGLWRRAGWLVGDGQLGDLIFLHFDRMLMLYLFGAIVWIDRRRHRTDARQWFDAALPDAAAR